MVRILNIVGYALGVLYGAGAGVAVGVVIKLLGGTAWLMTVGGLVTAALVGALIIFVVWMTGLVLWTLSDAADDARAVRAYTGC